MTPDWRRAACVNADPDIYFPDLNTLAGIGQAGEAKAICATCPIKGACRTFAVAEDIRHGIWGGTTPDERRPTTTPRRGRPLMPIEHGTTSGYAAHVRRDGQPPCTPCREAQNRYNQDRKRIRRAAQ